MEVGEGCGDVDGKYGVVVVVVEECLCELVEFFSSRGASDGILVWLESRGNGRGYLLGNSGGGYPTENGAACDGSDAAVGLE